MFNILLGVILVRDMFLFNKQILGIILLTKNIYRPNIKTYVFFQPLSLPKTIKNILKLTEQI